MIRTKLGTLASASFALSYLASKEIPMATSVKVALMAMKFNSEIKVFEEQHKKLFDELGVIDAKDPSGNTLRIPPQNEEVFREKFKVLADTEVELRIEPLTVAALGTSDIKAEALMALSEAGLLTLPIDPPTP